LYVDIIVVALDRNVAIGKDQGFNEAITKSLRPSIQRAQERVAVIKIEYIVVVSTKSHGYLIY
jgi:hypothetical protein